MHAQFAHLHTYAELYIHSCIHSWINFFHSGHFYSAPSSPLLLRGAPDYSTDTVSEFHAEAHSWQLHVIKGLAQSPYVAARARVETHDPPVESNHLNQGATTSRPGDTTYTNKWPIWYPILQNAVELWCRINWFCGTNIIEFINK